MASLNTTYVYGHVRVNGLASFESMKVDGVPIHVLDGDIEDVTVGNGSTDLVTAGQVVDYIQSQTISPSSTYYTTTNTGYGRLDIGWNPSVKYIKAGSGTASASLTEHTSLSNTNDMNSQYFSVSSSVNLAQAGWINSLSGSTVNFKVKNGSAMNGYMVTPGWMTTASSVYTITYDSTNRCVDFMFNN